MIIVHTVPGSPYGRAVLITCREKNVPYRIQRLGAGGSKSAEHLARHPFGRIPAIEDGDFALYETQAITRYIDAAYSGPSLVPADLKCAARMSQAIGIVDCYFFADGSAKTVGFNRIIAPAFGLPVSEAAVEAALPQTRHCIDVLTGLLGDAPYLAGDSFSLADLHAGPQLDLLRAAPEVAAMLEGSPLLAWLERLEARPSFLATTWDAVAAEAA